MKASWQEDYFKTLIRLHLLLPVNSKTGTNAISAVLWLDEDRFGLCAALLLNHLVGPRRAIIATRGCFRRRCRWTKQR